MKIISLNVWDGGRLFDGIESFLCEQQADVLMLQEVYSAVDPKLDRRFRTIDALQATLDYPYVDFAPAMIDAMPEGKIESGNAILSRFPIVQRQVHFLNEPFQPGRECRPDDVSSYPTIPRNVQHVTVSANGTSINLFNVHGVWDLNGDNYSPQRQQMSRIIIQAFSGLPNVILAGDTNARPTNKAIRDISMHLLSVFGVELQTTFNMRRKDDPGYASASVDMMFVSPNITVSAKSCPDVDISDHLPLVATVSV